LEKITHDWSAEDVSKLADRLEGSDRLDDVGRKMAVNALRSLQSKLSSCESELEKWKAAYNAANAGQIAAESRLESALEGNRAKGDGGHSRRCAQCDHWAVVDKCTICGAEEATDGAGISVEAALAKDLYEAQCRLDKALIALLCIYNTPPKLSEARDQEQGWWIALVDDMMGQAGNAISDLVVERMEPPVPKCRYCGMEHGYHDNSCPQREAQCRLDKALIALL
jgi:hypothetical protein